MLNKEELGMNKSLECDIIPSLLPLHCSLGDLQEGLRPVKRFVVGLLVVMI